jgi:hypothetical protein
MPKERRVHNLLEMVAIDLKGPININNSYKFVGYLVIVDIYYSYGTVFGVKKKTEITEKFIYYKNYMETQTDSKIKCVKSDQAKEYTDGEFPQLLRSLGIR